MFESICDCVDMCYFYLHHIDVWSKIFERSKLCFIMAFNLLLFFLLFKRGILSTSKVVDIMTVLCVYSMILFGVFFTDKANENLGIISIEGMNQIFYALLFIPWIYLNEKKEYKM